MLQSKSPVLNLALIPLFLPLFHAVPLFLLSALVVSLSPHVSVCWMGMTQWCWNEKSRAWAFLSKRTIKPFAVHNELTLIQLRCTSCLHVFSLCLFFFFFEILSAFITCIRRVQCISLLYECMYGFHTTRIKL